MDELELFVPCTAQVFALFAGHDRCIFVFDAFLPDALD